jgi:type IV fimbrial biogenesis protein FimT
MTPMATPQSTPVPTPCERSRQRGFTLLELMTTLAIAGILLGITVPAFQGMMVSSRLRTTTNDFAAAVNIARSEAITRNRPVTFCRVVLANDTACAAASDTWSNWVIRDAAGVIRRGSITNAGSVTVVSTLTDDRLVFSPDGLTRNATGVVVGGGTISICSSRSSNDNVRQLTLGSASRVTIDKTSGACP